MALDNFDQNTETLSGYGTVRDTVGIIYQNIYDNSTTPSETTSSARDRVQIVYRKRSFESTPQDIIKYRIKKDRTFSYAKITPPQPFNFVV